MKYLHHFKVPVPENLTNYKWEKSNFTVEEPSRRRLNHVSEVNAVRNGTNQNCMPPTTKP